MLGFIDSITGKTTFTFAMVLLASCSAQADETLVNDAAALDDATQTSDPIVAEENAASEEPEPGGLATIDPQPRASTEPEILEKEDITVNEKPACAFSISYPNAVPQPVTWNRETCGDISAQFISRKKLADMGKMRRLSEDERADMKAAAMDRVFYIESEFTASIYPLNSAGRVYEIVVAD